MKHTSRLMVGKRLANTDTPYFRYVQGYGNFLEFLINIRTKGAWMVTAGNTVALFKRHPWLAVAVCWALLLPGCSAFKPRQAEPRGFSLPKPLEKTSQPQAMVKPQGAGAGSSAQAFAVVLYASPVAQTYWASTGFDGRLNIQLWQRFLRKYSIPFQLITSVDQLESSSGNTLILPSAVALSQREKKAIARFRAKGGSVLSSWLTGVKNERGIDTGFEFMVDTLGVKVAGNTEKDAKDTFMILHGDSPVTHHLPAGMRIWMDRIKGLYPLRLEGKNTAAHIMDWSRKATLGKVSSLVVFDERLESTGMHSRSIALGYSEQLWVSVNPKLLEAVTHNALQWVMRIPSAYTATWPHPYRSALVTAVDVVDALTDLDMENAKRLEEVGGRATYYVVNEAAAKSAERLLGLQARGHEIAYLGDRYADFRDQPATVQAQRLDNMRRTMAAHGLAITPASGFHPPMDSYDRQTEKLLNERAFGHLLVTLDASEARLPFLFNTPVGSSPTGQPIPKNLSSRMVVLPRTQEGPDELVDNCEPEIGLKPFFREVELSEQMAALTVIPISSKNELTDAQRAEVFNHFGSRREFTWLTTSGQVADWWRLREGVGVRMGLVDQTLRLSIRIESGPAPTQAPAIWINLPEMGSTLQLQARGRPIETPRLVAVDAWRTAMLLDRLPPGEYHWDVRFSRSMSGDASL
ncbi:MAG: hypothetical protein U1D25_06440 [Hydrogenophaga sp.]|uniref:hypothetical protein n=1 Tax=Hydrogenophaga sp. TaxID=1904254 RepID=UPI002AB959CB|nr:hypothetical protein [Hydrogenophaga sp.]MDZ4187728.1 hypothetical protein [Hydrogenophaga sp.]